MNQPRIKLALLASVALLGFSTATSRAALAFDNVPTSSFSAFSTSSNPNYFMGDAYNLAAGTTAITGFDVYPVNVSGISFTGLKLNIYVWGSVNTSGTVNSSTPAFGNLLGTFSFTATGSFNTG